MMRACGRGTVRERVGRVKGGGYGGGGGDRELIPGYTCRKRSMAGRQECLRVTPSSWACSCTVCSCVCVFVCAGVRYACSCSCMVCLQLYGMLVLFLLFFYVFISG
jgi:hypothetical protein